MKQKRQLSKYIPKVAANQVKKTDKEAQSFDPFFVIKLFSLK